MNKNEIASTLIVSKSKERNLVKIVMAAYLKFCVSLFFKLKNKETHANFNN